MSSSLSMDVKINNKRKEYDENDIERDNHKKIKKMCDNLFRLPYTLKDINIIMYRSLYFQTIEYVDNIIKNYKNRKVFNVLIINKFDYVKCEDKYLKTKECDNYIGPGIKKKKCTNSITNVGCNYCEICMVSEFNDRNNKDIILKKNQKYFKNEYNFNYDEYLKRVEIDIDISEIFKRKDKKRYILKILGILEIENKDEYDYKYEDEVELLKVE